MLRSLAFPYATARRLRLCGIRRTSEIIGRSGMGSRASTISALCTGSVPPRTHDKLINERLPQTRQVSCGLSLMTSQSAQSTALRNQTAFTSCFSFPSIDTAFVVTFFR